MRYILISLMALFLFPGYALAETEEEEIARIQKEMNSRVFELDKPAPPPPVAPVAPPPPAPVVSAPASSGGFSETYFMGYAVGGVSLSMGQEAIIEALVAQGYTCNGAGLGRMAQAMPGFIMCIYMSTIEPKIMHLNVAGGVLRELALHEVYNGGFPEEYFQEEKAKFISEYGEKTKCKEKRRGEICEVRGQGYRISLRSKIKADDDKATLIRSVIRR